MQQSNNSSIHSINLGEKKITILGTAHVSKESADLVVSVIKEKCPDTVCIELCESRYNSIKQNQKWQETDIVKVIREKKTFLLLSNLLLASFQKRIAEKFDIRPGEEMIKAIETAESTGAEILLADRDIRVTLTRTFRNMGLWSKMKLFFQMILSLGKIDDITEEDIEKMKNEDVLESILSEVGKKHPVIKKILIDERDQYLAHKIRNAPGNNIVAVVGAGHLPGIKKYIDQKIDICALEKVPAKSKVSVILKWGLPSLILMLIIFGFFIGGAHAGTHMIKWWFLANGVLAGIGALAAMAHPLTIGSSILAAPLTSLNPMIAAGWVSGMVEALIRKPKVKDIVNLSDDILTIKGFWKNNVTRILLVVVFTNIGSAIGTFVAIPLMVNLL
jgi:pheromone shutdown-related protein TraB